MTSFCSQCGEAFLEPRELTLRGLAHRFFQAVTSIDSRLIRTSWYLLRRPGTLTLAYMNGPRKPYIAPFQLFLLANVLFFAVQSLTGTNVLGAALDSHLHEQDWSALAQSLLAQRLARTHTSIELYAPVFDTAVVVNAKSLIILMAVPFSLLLPLAYFRNRLPYSAHVVFSLHLYTFLLLLFSVAVLIATADVALGGGGLKSARVDNVLTVINLLACATYLYFATGAVYAARGAMRVVKAATLAIAVGAIVLGYRFLVFLITLYGT
jgi:hypothetical protein